jgi:hypothetical protein
MRPIERPRRSAAEFRKGWCQFERLTDDIDPHLYEVAEILDDKQ